MANRNAIIGTRALLVSSAGLSFRCTRLHRADVVPRPFKPRGTMKRTRLRRRSHPLADAVVAKMLWQCVFKVSSPISYGTLIQYRNVYPARPSSVLLWYERRPRLTETPPTSRVWFLYKKYDFILFLATRITSVGHLRTRVTRWTFMNGSSRTPCAWILSMISTFFYSQTEPACIYITKLYVSSVCLHRGRYRHVSFESGMCD